MLHSRDPILNLLPLSGYRGLWEGSYTVPKDEPGTWEEKVCPGEDDPWGQRVQHDKGRRLEGEGTQQTKERRALGPFRDSQLPQASQPLTAPSIPHLSKGPSPLLSAHMVAMNLRSCQTTDEL